MDMSSDKPKSRSYDGCFPQVTALNGFTTIDAELEFSLPLHERNGSMPHRAAGTQPLSTSLQSNPRSSKTPTATGKRDTMGDKKAKNCKGRAKAGAAAVEEQKGVNETPRNAEIASEERLPVHLHFSFVREPLGAYSAESVFSGSDTDVSHEVSSDDDDDDDDSNAPNRSGVEIEMLDDHIVEDEKRETTGSSDKATEPKRKLSRDKAGGEAGVPTETQKSKRGSKLKANARDATGTATAGDNGATQARVERRSNGKSNSNRNSNNNCEGIGMRSKEKQQEREGSTGRGHLKRAHSGHVEATAESAREDGKWKRSRVTDSRWGNEARARHRGGKGGEDDRDEDEDEDGDDEGWMIDGRDDGDDGDAMESILGRKGFLQTGSEVRRLSR